MVADYIKETIATLKTFPVEDPVTEMGFHLSELEEILSWKTDLEKIKNG